MKRTFLIYIILVCFFSSCQSYDDRINHARTLESQSKYKLAIKELQQLNKDYPEDLFVMAELINCYFVTNDFDSALKWCTKMLKIDPENQFATFNHSEAYRLEGNLNKSYEIILGLYYRTGGDFFELKMTNHELSPHNPFDVPKEEIIYFKGRLEIDLEKNEEAFESFTFCINRQYLLDESLYWRAIASSGLNYFGDACTDLKQSADLGNVESEKLYLENCE